MLPAHLHHIVARSRRAISLQHIGISRRIASSRGIGNNVMPVVRPLPLLLLAYQAMSPANNSACRR